MRDNFPLDPCTRGLRDARSAQYDLDFGGED